MLLTKILPAVLKDRPAVLPAIQAVRAPPLRPGDPDRGLHLPLSQNILGGGQNQGHPQHDLRAYLPV